MGPSNPLNHHEITHKPKSLSGTQFYQSKPSLKRQLEETISILEATLDATCDGILLVDESGAIIRYNHRFTQLWGIPESLANLRDDDVLIQFVLEQLVDPDAFLDKVKFLYTQNDVESSDEIAFKDGRFFERFSKPHTINGEIFGRVWSFRDITKQKQTEAKLQQLLDQEHQLRIESENGLQLREDFLSIASHELRTPLTPLHLHLQIFQRFLCRPEVQALPDGKTYLDLLGRAQGQVGRIVRLVEDLLDVSRISTGRLSLKPETVDLHSLVQEVVDRYAPQLKKAGCDIILQFQDEAVGEWDRLRIEQVVINLLSNAMKFGAGKPIEISVRLEFDQVILNVVDHGIGISEIDQNRLFNRFERAVSHKQFGGLGLGLYIVRQIIEGHNGSIRLQSQVGEGSRFTVILPKTGQIRP